MIQVAPLTMVKETKMRYFLLTFILLTTFQVGFNQTLFSVDGDDVSVDEFKRMYEKSQVEPDEKYSKESINEYVDIYLKYKLKLKEASKLGVADDPEVLREIASYEDQLIRNEFDQKVMNNLLSEARQRLQEEICMRHILIDIPNRYKGTADTIYSYNQALKVRERLIAGEDFEQVAKKTSRDIDTKFTGGDLGCFTTLQLKNYALENQAYKLNRGQISMPVRTQLGYHIIEITDRRSSNGIVSAKQLFIRSNNTLEKEEQFEAETVIRSAHRQLLQGIDFDEVGSWLRNETSLQTSLDLIPEFTVGSYDSAFENGIFGLNSIGDFSRPTKTSLGWHIFQLTSRSPLPDWEVIESNVRDKIIEDERFAKARLKFGQEIKTRYNYEKNEETFNLFAKHVAPGISIDGWQTPSSFDYSEPLFQIEDRVYPAQQFVNYVREEHSLERFNSFETYYNNFETTKLMDFHKHNVAKTDPEMKHLLQEYRDGIILFNVMEQEFWKESTVDDAEVEDYYQETKELYKGDDVVLVDVYTLSDIELADKVKEILIKDNLFSSISKLEKRNKIQIPLSQKKLTSKEAIIKEVDLWDLGSVVMRKNDDGNWEVLKSKEIIEGLSQSFSEVKAKVLSAYQKEQETEWLDDLKNKYSVEINDRVVQSLIK